MKIIRSHSYIILLAGTVIAALAISSSAFGLTTFTPGTPAKASEVNANFSELSDRLDALEFKHDGPSISVDCSADANDLINKVATAPAGATLNVSGTCAGPVTVKRDRIRIVAQTAGVDGVTSNVAGRALLAIKSRLVSVEGLKIVSTATAESYGLGVFDGGSAKLTDIHVSGATESILVGRSATARVIDTTDIDNIFVYEAASCRIEGSSQGFDIFALRNGTVDIHTNPGAAFTGIRANTGGMVRARWSADLAVNGRVTVSDGGVEFKVSVTLTYMPTSEWDHGLSLVGNATAVFKAGGTVKTSVSVDGASAMQADGVSFVDPVDASRGGSVFVGARSVVGLRNGSSVGPLTLDYSASLFMDSSSAAGDARIGPGCELVLTASSLVGNINTGPNANITMQGSSNITATRAAAGVCPTDYSQGIRLNLGSVLVRRDAGSTITGYVEVDKMSALQDNTWSGYGGTVDVSNSTLSNLQSLGVSTGGINICN